MARHRPRAVFHVFRFVLIIVVMATLLAAAADLPAAPALPLGGPEAGAPEEAEPRAAAVEGQAQGPEQERAERLVTVRRASLPAETPEGTQDLPDEGDPAPRRPPRVCTGAIPFGAAAAAGDALPYAGAGEPLPAGAWEGLAQVLSAYLSTLRGTYGVAIIDLTTGATASVGGDRVFVAASTFKVPLAMYIFSLVERGEADLAEPLYYVPADWEGGTGILHGAVPGDCYTVAELVNLSLTVSDNIATNMLLRRFGEQNVFAYMRELGGTVTNLPTGRRATTPRDMARYMEIAYRRAAREDGGLYRTLLGLLTQTAFSDRIAAGAPAGVPVAHKIGTLPAMVHDVGIVFLPGRPFAIALFSEGVSEPVAAARLADITHLVSDYLLTGTAAGAAPPGASLPDPGEPAAAAVPTEESPPGPGSVDPNATASDGGAPAPVDPPAAGAPASGDLPPAGVPAPGDTQPTGAPASGDPPPAGVPVPGDAPPTGVPTPDDAPPAGASPGADAGSPAKDGSGAGDGVPAEDAGPSDAPAPTEPAPAPGR